MKQQKIELPTLDEKQRSIDIIMEFAPEKPQSYFREVGKLLEKISVHGLFFGVIDAVFLAITAAIIISLAIMAISIERMHSVMFFISPLTYILLYSLTMWKERLSGTLELHRTLRITPRHITAVRMLFFGAFSLAVNGIISAFAIFASRHSEITVSFFRLLEISFCSLLVFAVILLFIMLKFPNNKLQIAFIAMWCIVGIVAIIQVENLLQSLPAFTLTGIAVLFATIFIIESKIYFKGVKHYAIGQ